MNNKNDKSLNIFFTSLHIIEVFELTEEGFLSWHCIGQANRSHIGTFIY